MVRENLIHMKVIDKIKENDDEGEENDKSGSVEVIDDIEFNEDVILNNDEYDLNSSMVMLQQNLTQVFQNSKDLDSSFKLNLSFDNDDSSKIGRRLTIKVIRDDMNILSELREELNEEDTPDRKRSVISDPPVGGQLTLKIVKAQLERDTEAFGKMDPFCVIKYGTKEYRTQVKDEAGKTPVWNQEFKFFVDNIQKDLVMTVFDKDLTSDDLVGRIEVQISDIISRDNNQDDITLNLTFEEKVAGKLTIKTHFDWPLSAEQLKQESIKRQETFEEDKRQMKEYIKQEEEERKRIEEEEQQELATQLREKLEAQKKEREEQERLEKEEADRKAKEEQERLEAERKAKEEKERLEKEEAERKAKEEEERLAKIAKEEAERKTKEEEEQRVK